MDALRQKWLDTEAKASSIDLSGLLLPWVTSIGGNAAKANSAKRACATVPSPILRCLSKPLWAALRLAAV